MGRKSFIKILGQMTLCLWLLMSGCAAGGAFFDGKEAEEVLGRELLSGRYESGKGKVKISEVMSKNKTTFFDSDGDTADWIEIENLTEDDLNLAGWSLSDRAGKTGWIFPEFTLYKNSRAIIFASGKEIGAPGELHASFAISEGETVYLRDRNGETVSSARILEDKADRAYIPDESGICTETCYPTPGRENTRSAYVWLESEKKHTGPLIINEVCVDGEPDWVEIKNISSLPVNLSGYCLSDTEDDPEAFLFPNEVLYPGALYVVECMSDRGKYVGFRPIAPFSLDSCNDRLYLSTTDGTVIDCLALRDIPVGGSYGRMDGENGSFFFERTSAGSENHGGKRYLGSAPVLMGRDGVFDGVTQVTVELSAEGEIYYTTDGSRPTRSSAKYTGPFTVGKTCTVRAISVQNGAVDSNVLTLNYIINEGHSLPVVCLCTDNTLDFGTMYYGKVKGYDIPGCVSFYGEDGGRFSAECGVRLNGYSTLELAKRNLSLSFTGKYGNGALDYDVFGGGNTEFSNLLLRSGGDQLSTIVRSEACSNICAGFTDKVVSQRSRYCVLYVNGTYCGIYSLMEKANEALYASWANVSRGSVSLLDASVEPGSEMYEDVVRFILSGEEHLSDPKNYARVCEHLNIDSFIDWCVFEGWTGNNDLTYGNLRYAKSAENGGKWTCMLYDLDAAFKWSGNCVANVAGSWNQITDMNMRLLENAEYKDKFLSRMAEALSGPLTEEAFLDEMERLYALIDPEVKRDSTVSGLGYDYWKSQQQELRTTLENGWNAACIANTCELLELTEEECRHYFGKFMQGEAH